MRPSILLIAVLPLLLAADKRIDPVKAGNQVVDITGVAAENRESVKALLGVDPGLEMIAVEITLRAKTDAGLTVSRDDFWMISRKDGQRSTAVHPSQIAGSGGLVVATRNAGASGGLIGGRRGPVWGGMPGIGSRPERIGGNTDIPAGIAEGETAVSTAEGKASDTPVLAALKKKELPEAKVSDEVTGLLYFIFEGKHKVKDLELMYKSPDGLLTLDFKR